MQKPFDAGEAWSEAFDDARAEGVPEREAEEIGNQASRDFAMAALVRAGLLREEDL